MNKSDAILILNDCFSTEGQCALLHLMDGSDLLLTTKPIFSDFLINAHLEYTFDGNKIPESAHIPFSSVLYIVVTTMDNLKILFGERDSV